MVCGDYFNVFIIFDFILCWIGEMFFIMVYFDLNMVYMDEIFNLFDFLIGELVNLFG